MDDLRIVLLIAGVVLIGGIYVFGRLSRRGGGGRGRSARRPRRGIEHSESVSLGPRREAEVSEPFSRGPDFDTGGTDSGTAAREAYRGPGGEGSESAAREPNRGAEAPEPVSQEARHDTGGEGPGTAGRGLRRAADGDDPDRSARKRHAAFDPRPVDGDYDVDALGGMFAPRRKTPDEELSVDVGVLSGMRAFYEGSVDESVPPPGEGKGQPALYTSQPIVFLTLIAKRGRLPGHAILDAFDAEGFEPGPMRIYHYRGNAEPGPPVAFGVANLVEPGVLEPDSLPGIHTPGLVMFMGVAHDVADASRTLEAMIAAGRRIADRLDATLCDETRSTLTAQAENHLRETVADVALRGRG